MTLTQAEMKKVLVVEKVMDGHMTNKEGANSLGLSERQLIRLKKKYEAEGAEGISHQNRGKKPKHALSDEVKDRAAVLYTTKYLGSNSCHFAELLKEHEDLHLSSSSVRRVLLVLYVVFHGCSLAGLRGCAELAFFVCTFRSGFSVFFTKIACS